MIYLRKTKILVGLVSLLFLGFTLLSTTNIFQEPWAAPAKYKTMKNPQKGKADSENIGKTLFGTHCKSCHGTKGLGDGKKSTELESVMRSFASADVQKQTDGELYYKSFIGRNEMPNYEKKIKSENDRWLLINYLRTLKK